MIHPQIGTTLMRTDRTPARLLIMMAHNEHSMACLRRKQLLEAWESAEWESREAQIRALQEEQLAEFEHSIKAKHAQVIRVDTALP